MNIFRATAETLYQVDRLEEQARKTNYNNETAFTRAVRRRDYDLAEALIQYSNTNHLVKGKHPLVFAIENNDAKMLRLLVPHCKVWCDTLYHSLVDVPDYAEILLPHTDKEIIDRVFIRAVGLNEIKIIERLSKIVELSTRSSPNNFLVISAGYGHLELCRYFLEFYDINEKDEYGSTPLIMAVRSKHPDVVRFLLENGANCGIEDEYGRTAENYAIHSKDCRDVFKEYKTFVGHRVKSAAF